MEIKFTPTQARMMKLLKDGQGHGMSELIGCLEDELAGSNAVSTHLASLRKLLRRHGQDILCNSGPNKISSYRLVRLMASPNDGKR